MTTFTKKTIATAQDSASFYHGDDPALFLAVRDFVMPARDAGLTDGVVVKDPATLTFTRVWVDQAAAESYVNSAQSFAATNNYNITFQIVDNT